MNTLFEIDELQKQVMDGEVEALRAFIVLRQVEKHLKDAIDSIKDLAAEEAEGYGEKEFELEGCKVSVRNGAGRWSFKGLPDWEDHKARLKGIEDLHKQAYKMIGKGGVHTEDGEVVEPAQFTPGGTVVALVIPKN